MFEPLRSRGQAVIVGARHQGRRGSLADGRDRQRRVHPEARGDRGGVHAEQALGPECLAAVGPGSKRRRAIRKLELERLTKLGKVRVWSAEPRKRYRLLVGTRAKRVRWLAIADPTRLPNRKRIRTALGHAR